MVIFSFANYANDVSKTLQATDKLQATSYKLLQATSYYKLQATS